jgi:hypothetical protein
MNVERPIAKGGADDALPVRRRKPALSRLGVPTWNTFLVYPASIQKLDAIVHKTVEHPLLSGP